MTLHCPHTHFYTKKAAADGEENNDNSSIAVWTEIVSNKQRRNATKEVITQQGVCVHVCILGKEQNMWWERVKEKREGKK